MTNVPNITFGATGFLAPTEAAILAGVEADFTAAFGSAIDLSPTTPQGQLCASLAAIIADCYDQECALFNGVDPAFSSGRLQDAIGRLYFLTRNPAQSTVTACTVTGSPGTVIPIGAIALAEDGNTYTCTGAVTIPGGGSTTANFACVATGPIACPAGTLNQIFRAIPGWDTITNPADGVEGTNVESAQQFEARREATVAGNSVGAIGAIIGAVAEVAGVLDYWGYNNGTASPVTVSGVTIAANSIYISVEGGTSLDVAQAILSKLAPGCGTVGNTTVTAYDDNPLYSAPVPYSINFEIPTALEIFALVSIANTPQVPADALSLIQGAMANAFDGADGGPRARIGTTLYASRFYAGIAALGTWANIVSIGLGSVNSPDGSFTGSITGTALTSGSLTGTIAIGDFIFGAGVAAGTMIVSGSGTSWVVSISQTVGSEAMKAITPDANDVAVNANQTPTLNVGDIALVLV